ncbi:MAG: 16S rRNA (guanine(527)-N(7))-methyltransferase RsmG [Proteobacteria bacterium]|nr:16S rRNA (guanine(527)-N(7))-methyltransferase RsmG [Pseudomonadota bacterium]
MEKLKIYQALLEKWQKKINLVAPSTTPHLWERHFKDSLQLISHLPQVHSSLLDLGSGAGFPGLVLAISQCHNLSVTLIESDVKKCLFLENVSRETNIPVVVINERIENLEGKLKGDIITARGLAPLSLLINYALPLMKPESFCLFLKGKEYESEINEAKKKWEFELEIFESLTDSRARILKLTHPKRITADDKNNSRC